MCGICGVVRLDRQAVPSSLVERMAGAIAHRGPDDSGVWADGPVGLGHRRLAILDLSPTGHQPMCNESKDVFIVYNGELYNHPDLRVELESLGHHYHSRSDTETIIHAYEAWGVDCLQRFNGMFALAIWDAKAGRIVLARDRFGVKPLYYFYDGMKLIFSSEIKAILAHPGFSSRLCYPALDEYFTFQNILTDLTLFEGIKILPAGHYLAFNIHSEGSSGLYQYWDYDFTSPLTITFEEAVDELHRLFNQAVARQLMSDVPIGCYLSGGMDSGSITAVARQHLGRLTTFTGGFDLSSASGLELGFDERVNAESLANQLKTEHYEMVLHAGDMEAAMPELIWHLEDLRVGQCYPNYYIARLAGKFVKVVLSGAGGDELFGGYPWRYFRGIHSQGEGDYHRNYYEFWQRLVNDQEKSALFNPETLREVNPHSTFDVFRRIIQGSRLAMKTRADFINASLYFEIKTFLHGLLVVEDKVSMAHSLETRVPFLDNDLVDFACSLPPEFKLRYLDQITQSVDENEAGKRLRYDSMNQDGKLILREAMKRVIPRDITSRGKQGFSAPDASWFRGESIDYVNNLLLNKRARIYEVLSPAYVSSKLEEHSSGLHNHRLFIWSLLSLEWWLKKFMLNG